MAVGYIAAWGEKEASMAVDSPSKSTINLDLVIF